MFILLGGSMLGTPVMYKREIISEPVASQFDGSIVRVFRFLAHDPWSR
jgi:hypothetical protein